MKHIQVGNVEISAPVADMLNYLDKFFTEIIEAESLSGAEREAAFVKVAHSKYALMSSEEAIGLSKGVDVTD